MPPQPGQYLSYPQDTAPHSDNVLMEVDVHSTSTNAAGDTKYATVAALVNAGLGGTSAAQNSVLAGPATGGAGAPSFRALAASDVPTLNQNTTGTSANITATLDQVPAPAANVGFNGHKGTSVANGTAGTDVAAFGQTPAGGSTATIPQGGTGQITQQAAIDALAGAVTSGQYLRGNGTHVQMSAIQSGDLPAATTSAQGAVTLSPVATHLSPSWSARWQSAKAAALAATGTAKVAVIGDSWASGQSTGTVTDCLLYGWVGRLNNLLATQLGAYADGYTLAGVSPGNLTSPSSPYGNSALPSNTTSDGGIGQVWTPSGTGSTFVTISAPRHPVTNAYPSGLDILTVDFNTSSWQYAVDGGSAVTVTPSSGTPPNGVNGTVGSGILRRTSITLTGNTTHSITVQQNGANALAMVGHITYYGTTGLGMMRAPVPGWKAIDFATGGGSTASQSSGTSLTPDHILPWSGVSPTSPNGLVNNNIYASAASGFPFSGVDLAIISLGGNDCTQGSSVEAMRKALTRFVNAFRRGSPATGTTSQCSILFLTEAYASEYSDDSGAASPTNTEWQRYKQVIYDLAQMYGCGYLDLQQVFGETPVARGYMGANGAHPTQNGGGSGGGDGHLAIAQAIYGVL